LSEIVHIISLKTL